MNFFRINIFIISIFFSVDVFAGPAATFFKRFSDWSKRQIVQKSIEQNDSVSYSGLDSILVKSERKKALDIIVSGMENNFYSSLYSYLEQQPDLARIINDRGTREATNTLVIALVAMGRSATRNRIDLIWRRGIDENIFLKLWDMEQVRLIMAGSIEREHLIDNPQLLLKYWQAKDMSYYVGSRYLPKEFPTLEDRFVYFIYSSLHEMDVSVDFLFHNGFERFFNEHPFGRTLFRAFRERNDFASEVYSIMEKVAQRVRRLPGSEKDKFDHMLERGRIFDEAIREEISPSFRNPGYDLNDFFDDSWPYEGIPPNPISPIV